MKQYILFLLLFLPFFAFSQGTNKDTVKVLPFDSLTAIGWTSLDTADQIFIYDSQTQTFAYRITWGQILRGVDTAYLATKRYVDSAEITFKDIMALGTDYLADGGDSTDFKITNADQIVLNSNGAIQLFTDSFNLNLIAQLGTVRLQGGSYRMIGLDEASATEQDTLIGLLGVTSVNDSVELFKFSDLMFDFVGDSVLVDTSYFASKEYVNSSMSSSPGLDSLIQSGKTFTFYAGDSTYSMQSIDTFFLENGVYKIVVGSDTLSANLSVNFGNILYVTSDGNDATAVKGSPDFTWARIDSAYANASQGDVIVVQNKDTLSFLDTVFLTDGKDFNLFLSDGAVVSLGEITVSAVDVNSDINIIGNGTILAEDDICFVNSENTDVTFIVNSVKATEVSVAYIVSANHVGNITMITNSMYDFCGARITDSVVVGKTIFFKTEYRENNRSRYGFSAETVTINFSPLVSDNNITIDIGGINDSTGSTYFKVDGTSIIDNNFSFSARNGRMKNRATLDFSSTSPLFFIGETVDSIENIDFYVSLDNIDIDAAAIYSFQAPPDSNIPDDVNFYFNGTVEMNNHYAFTNYTGNTIYTQDGTGLNYYVDMNIKSDTTIFKLNNGGFYGDLHISGDYQTYGFGAPIIEYNDTSVVTPVPSNLYLGNINMEVAGSQKPIDGDGEIFFYGSATQNNDIIDADFTFTRLSDIGSNSIADRLAFGNYTIDQNTSSLRLDTLNQFVVVTENSQSYYSLGGNIEIRADSGNVVLNGGPTGELKMQGDSLTASITGAGVSNDGMTGVFVQNDAGETRLTSRLLPQFDTVNVSTANDTIDIDFAFDQTVVVNMNSAPATVDFVVQNPVKGSTLTLVFTSVGSSHTFNFGHTDIQLATKTGWTIDSAAAKVYVLRYNIDGGGDWIIVRDE